MGRIILSGMSYNASSIVSRNKDIAIISLQNISKHGNKKEDNKGR